MKNFRLVYGIFGVGLGLVAFLPINAQADVKIQRFTHFNEVTGITAHDSTTTDYIHGDMKREENTRKFTGAVLSAWQHFRHEDKGALSVDIYNVGQNKHFDLDPKEKTYSEEPIYTPPQPGDHEESGQSESENGSQQQEKQNNDTKVTKNQFTVKATGKKKNINGFDTSEYLITWDVETENTKTGEKNKSLMTTDMWTSMDSNLAKAHQEEAAYNTAYRKLMHEPANLDEMRQYGFSAIGNNTSSANPNEFFKKLKTIKGYAVSTDVSWQTWSSSNNNKNQGQRQSLDSAIGSLFGSHKKKENTQTSNNGMTTIFSSHVEIKSVDLGNLDNSLFAVPKDYKKD